MPSWTSYTIVVLIAWAAITLNYEIGYENGLRDCYGCGVFDEPVMPRLWGPWLDFTG